MIPRNRLAATALVAFAVLVGLFVYWNRSSDEHREPVLRTRRSAQPAPNEKLDEVLRGLGAKNHSESTDSGDRATRVLVIRGRVLSARDGAPLRATVYIRDVSGDTESGPRIKEQTAADGSYSLSAEVPRTLAEPTFDVGAVATDHMRQVIRHTGAVPEWRIDFRLESGASLQGHVVDEEGHGVPDVALYLANGNLPVAMATTHTFDKEHLALGGTDSDYHEARVRTDRLGVFRARGLGAGTYRVFSLDPKWFIQHEARFTPGQPDVTVVAVPANTVVGEVVDADSLAPLRRFHVEVVVLGAGNPGYSYSLSGQGRNGRLLLTWGSRAGESEAGDLDIEVAVSARGYTPVRRRSQFTRTARVLREDFMVKRHPQGDAVLEVVDTAGVQQAIPLQVALVDPLDENRTVGPLVAESLELGRYRLHAPIGTWRARVVSTAPLGSLVSWTGELSILERHDSVVRVVLPRHGTLLLRGGRSRFSVRILGEDAVGPRGGVFSFDGPEARIPGFPEGSWRFALLEDGRVHEVEVVVTAGSTSLVEWSR